jgi:hypothetical protein
LAAAGSAPPRTRWHSSPRLAAAAAVCRQWLDCDGAGGNEGVRALRQRLTDQIFEFAGLVAPEGQARQIVTLDKDPGPA